VVTPVSPSNICVDLSSLLVIFPAPIGKVVLDVLMTSLVNSSWLGEGSSPVGRVRADCGSYSVEVLLAEEFSPITWDEGLGCLVTSLGL
jgi:hypothetical protein